MSKNYTEDEMVFTLVLNEQIHSHNSQRESDLMMIS